MPQNNELRVFISSTFRDLQEEREHLVKKIFPEIRALCRERGITFTEVDLRWGLTEEEAILGRVIRTCLEEVDKCRPYFIGIIGNRYGWAPELHEILMDPDLLAKYPWIEDVAMEGASVTEMEFIHGVFNAEQVEGEYAFFYHRSGDLLEADNPERLRSLLERVMATGRPMREFATLEELGQEVRDDLLQMIESYWPQSQTPTTVELERRSHAAFAASRIRAYIPNPLHLKEFTRWTGEGAMPLIVSGESGLGKSSLVAYLVEYYRKNNPAALAIEHYIGASQTSGSAVSVIRHVIEEIRERFGISEELPVREEELEKSFPNWLYRCEHLAAEAGIGVLIVIDAVNQLSQTGRRLTWLPKKMPAGIRLMISTTPGETETRLAELRWEGLTVIPLVDERVRQSIVVRYLGEFHKGITPEQVRQVTGSQNGGSPLYLRVVAEELRLHGEHETVDALIARYTGAVDLLEVFERILERMESDYGEKTVRQLLELIWASRSGLSESELLELMGLSRLDLSRLLFALDYHLSRHDGLLGFFHDYLRRAVEKRYLSDEASQKSTHLQLAEYFQRGVTASIAGSGTTPIRMARELVYQLHAGGAMERLKECLSRMPVFLTLFSQETPYEVMGYWSAMGEGSDVEECYRRGLEQWGVEDAGERSAGVGQVAELLQRLGHWAGAITLERERCARAVDRGDNDEEARSRLNLGWLLHMRGENAEASGELEQARDIFTKLGDRTNVSNANENIGLVHFTRGEYDRALECFHHKLSITTELGDNRGIASAIGNIGLAYADRGEYDRALDCYQRQLNIAMELGDYRSISAAHSNMGVVYSRRGEYDRALESFQHDLSICEKLGDLYTISVAIANMGAVYERSGEYDRSLECFQHQLKINEELGDRSKLSIVIANMGVLYDKRGEYDRALESFQQALSMSEELGDPRVTSFVNGNMAMVYDKLGEQDRALECFHRAEEGHRAIGFLFGLSYWLKGTVEVLLGLVHGDGAMPEYLPKYLPDGSEEQWRAVTVAHARKYAEECIAISDELSNPDMQSAGRIMLARVEAAEGATSAALQRLNGMLAEAASEEQQAHLHYWLWKLGASGHGATALALYELLNSTIPKSDYRELIEDLQAAGADPAGGGSS